MQLYSLFQELLTGHFSKCYIKEVELNLYISTAWKRKLHVGAVEECT